MKGWRVTRSWQLKCFTPKVARNFPFSAQERVASHVYKFKWMTRGQLQRRFRQIVWQQKIRTARKRRLAYHRDTSLALKIIQHEDFRIHLEVKNTIETLIKIYMHRACGMCRLWNKYGCPEPLRYQTIYSPKFTNSVKIHIQHIMHASQYATSILRTFRWPTQKMITVRP